MDLKQYTLIAEYLGDVMSTEEYEFIDDLR